MFYRKKDIKRIAGEFLIDEFKKNTNLSFSNSSFSGRGDILGSFTIDYNRNTHKEGYLHYILLCPTFGSDSVEYNLVREETITQYEIKDKNNNVITPYSKYENTDIVKTFYLVRGNYYDDNSVFTDDYSSMVAAVAKRKIRDTFEEENNLVDIKILDENTNLYNRCYKFIVDLTDRKIKYGSQISTQIRRGKESVYNCESNCMKKKSYVELCLYYTYRNKKYVLIKSHINY